MTTVDAVARRHSCSFLFALGLVVLASACQTAEPPDPFDTRADALPDTAAPEGWAAPAGDDGAVDRGWVDTFGDPQLSALVDEALAHNADLRVVGARVDRAVAMADLAAAGLKPSVGMAAGTAGFSGDAVGGGGLGAGLGVSWEADVWGRVRAGAAAADESLRASRADFEASRQSIAAQTAKAWFLATESKLQVELAQQTVDLLAEIVTLVESRIEAGLAPEQDGNLARADLATAEDALRQARSGSEQALRSLEVLLGRYPSADTETATELVAVPPPIPVGVPSDILERRPDLIAAERRVASAFFLTEEAELAKLPRFTLTAGVGTVPGIANAIAGMAAGVVTPIYSPELDAQIAIATADQKIALAAYGAAMLVAFQEVETALSNEALFAERERFLLTAVEEYQNTYDLTAARYKAGVTELISVQQVQERLIAAQVGLLAIRDARLALRVDLHLALGGSFEVAESQDVPVESER